jgi:hypothetical protein
MLNSFKSLTFLLCGSGSQLQSQYIGRKTGRHKFSLQLLSIHCELVRIHFLLLPICRFVYLVGLPLLMSFCLVVCLCWRSACPVGLPVLSVCLSCRYASLVIFLSCRLPTLVASLSCLSVCPVGMPVLSVRLFCPFFFCTVQLQRYHSCVKCMYRIYVEKDY